MSLTHSHLRQRLRPFLGVALFLVFGLSDCCIRPALATQWVRLVEDAEKDSKEEYKASVRQNSGRGAARRARSERPWDQVPGWVTSALIARASHSTSANSLDCQVAPDHFGNGLGTRLRC